MTATPSAPGATKLTTLTGAELVPLIGAGPQSMVVPARLIADLNGAGQTADIANTAIGTVGDGTLTAAGLIGGLITRTGPVAAYTDTTATAAQIVTAIGSFNSGATFFVRIKNGTSFLETLAAGAGVTLPPSIIVGPWQEALYYGVIGGTSASPTVILNHLQTTVISGSTGVASPAITALATNGAGTITAASIAGKFVNRTTVAAPFTDTTDTATAIVAANPGLIGKVGASAELVYINSTVATATITGGAGVTVSGITQVGPGDTASFVLTQTAANTITMVGTGSGVVTGSPASTSGANLFVSDVYRTTAPVTANATVTPATVTGLSGAIAVGTYRFRAFLPSTVASGTGGIAYNSLLTTAVMSAMECTGHGFTSAAVAVQHTTTATTGAALFTQAAVVISVLLEGTFVVSTAGTFAIQMAQNTSNASNTVALLGGYLELTRIA